MAITKRQKQIFNELKAEYTRRWHICKREGAKHPEGSPAQMHWQGLADGLAMAIEKVDHLSDNINRYRLYRID
jgi:hypothetical protein